MMDWNMVNWDMNRSMVDRYMVDRNMNRSVVDRSMMDRSMMAHEGLRRNGVSFNWSVDRSMMRLHSQQNWLFMMNWSFVFNDALRGDGMTMTMAMTITTQASVLSLGHGDQCEQKCYLKFKKIYIRNQVVFFNRRKIYD